MDSGFLDRMSPSGRKYVVYVPDAYRPATPWPAILFLHGRGESGSDGLFQLWHGVPRNLLKNRVRWPFIVVCPQKPELEGEWFEERAELDAILKQVERDFNVDQRRTYLTGISQGGRGTMRLARALRWRFAALAPVCGWVDDPNGVAASLGDAPIWLFHGEADDVIPPSGSSDVAEALRGLGHAPKLTLYPNVGHNAWDLAYDEALPEWFLSHAQQN